MTDDAPPAVPASGALRLAMVVEAHDAGGTVRFLDDPDLAHARWSDAIRRRGILVRPGQLVLLAPAAGAPAAAPAFEVVWRGPDVVRVTSVDGERVTYAAGAAPARAVTKTVRDDRPEEERQPILAGQQLVVFPVRDDPQVVSLVDLAVDGLPVHAGRVRAACVARAHRVLQGAPATDTDSAAPAALGVASADDPRRLVAEGYDRMAERYAAWIAEGVSDDARPRYLALLLDRLPAGARVLELGCGGGGPTTRQLAARFALTGLDLSARQIELARANVPAAAFIHGDMTSVAFPPQSFDAVASFYAFGHLPYGELPGMLRKIGRWLRPGGLLVATVAGADPGTIEPDWLGVPMYFSGYAPEDARGFLAAAGLRIETLQEETITEDGQPVGFLWVVAHKPAAPPS